MGEAKKPLPVKLILGMITSITDLFSSAEEVMSSEFGSIDYYSEILPFDYTTYYKAEMGTDLKRKFISFTGLISPDAISNIKAFTNRMEQDFLLPHRGRSINLDPGYVSQSKLVLATK